MTYEPIVLEKWVSNGHTHRLVVSQSGHLRIEFPLWGQWHYCSDPSCIPIFRRPRARK